MYTFKDTNSKQSREKNKIYFLHCCLQFQIYEGHMGCLVSLDRICQQHLIRHESLVFWGQPKINILDHRYFGASLLQRCTVSVLGQDEGYTVCISSVES